MYAQGKARAAVQSSVAIGRIPDQYCLEALATRMGQAAGDESLPLSPPAGQRWETDVYGASLTQSLFLLGVDLHPPSSFDSP